MGTAEIRPGLGQPPLHPENFLTGKEAAMISDRLKLELIAETTLEDISENYRPVVEIIGIEKFIELSDYAKGDELYFPKVENVIAPARNRRIKKEWDGYNSKELAEKYNLTLKQIGNILKGEQW